MFTCLKKLQAFINLAKNLTQNQLETFIQDAEFEGFRIQHKLFNYRDIADSVYIIVSGEVALGSACLKQGELIDSRQFK